MYVPRLEPPGMLCTSMSTFRPARVSRDRYSVIFSLGTVTCEISGCAGSRNSVAGSPSRAAKHAHVTGKRTREYPAASIAAISSSVTYVSR